MARHLVIVESAAKARTLGRLLGSDYLVRASLGHVRDLPGKRLGVDTARGFVAEYEVLAARRRIVRELRQATCEADIVWLAADPDREGEAICWHLAAELAPALAGKPLRRVAFHEITRRAVDQAFAAPRAIDPRRVDTQQTRRILDRLVGYSLSPLLWRELRPGLSAGRVQSVALRIVCDRERAIAGFQPREHWPIQVRLDAGTPPLFAGTLVEVAGVEREVASASEAEAIGRALETACCRVRSLDARERRRTPPPPFVTATLQQESYRRLRRSISSTMRLAQRLYEGVELGSEGPVGLITYTRTDSPLVDAEAVAEARAHVARAYGEDHLPQEPNAFRPAAGAQLAHQAIRPTDLARTPESLAGVLGADELALYALVYERFVASQMAAAVYHDTHLLIEALPLHAAGPPHLLRAKGSSLRFAGFLAALGESARGEARAGESSPPLPALVAGQALRAVGVEREQRFTEPPARYSEASLVKELERCGIGRPSTYASILATLDGRDYVSRVKGRLVPTPLGFEVVDLLAARFPELLSPRYTASLEERLDAIEAGRETLLGVLTSFWRVFEPALAAARPPLPPVARRPLPPPPNTITCPRCNQGRVVERAASGRVFFGCSRFPSCRFTSRHPLRAESCPECGRAYLFLKETKREGRLVFCGNESCHYHRAE